jgi:uncharacterized protein (TIGR02246 family)
MSTRRLVRSGAAFVLAAVLACAAASSLGAEHRVTSPAQAAGSLSAEDIARVSEQWVRFWAARQLEPVLALYADDAVFLPSVGTHVAGKTAIRDLFTKALAGPVTPLRVCSVKTEQSGNLAYDSGEFEEVPSDGAKAGHGSYLVILRRDAANRWLIVQHMWTDVPAGQ